MTGLLPAVGPGGAPAVGGLPAVTAGTAPSARGATGQSPCEDGFDFTQARPDGADCGSTLALRLEAPTAAAVTYLTVTARSHETLLVGENGLAAPTFCEVPVADHRG